MRDLLRGLAADGRAILVSSHLLAELAEVADRVAIIDRGRLVADATLTELLAGRSRIVELRCADPSAVTKALRDRRASVDVDRDLLVIEGSSPEEIGKLVTAIGAGPIYQLAERTGTFEDVYFELAADRDADVAGTDDERSES